MAKVSTYSFGSGKSPVSFTPQEISTGSTSFDTTELQKKLGTGIPQGDFAITDGLTGFDTSSVFTPQPQTSNSQETDQSTSVSTPSQRPYVWKPYP